MTSFYEQMYHNFIMIDLLSVSIRNTTWSTLHVMTLERIEFRSENVYLHAANAANGVNWNAADIIELVLDPCP